MDHRRQHHPNPNHNQNHNPHQFTDSRYVPSRPTFHGNLNLFPPPPPPHHYTLPPRPQLPPPPPPLQFHPPSEQYHQTHQHQQQQRPHEPNFVIHYKDSHHSSRVLPPDHGVVYDRQQAYFPDPPRVSVSPAAAAPAPSIVPPISNVGLNWNHENSLHRRPVDFNPMMSPSFGEIDGFRHGERFGGDFRSTDELRDWRVMEDVVERERIQGGRHFHDEYHPEMMLRREFDMNPGVGEFMREPGEVLIRDGRDSVMMDYDGYGEFYDEEALNRGPELGRYCDYDRGRRQEMQDYNRTPRKNVRKKSALLRIQPLKHSSFKNRQDTHTTPSPHKGKESLEGLSKERDGSSVELDISFKSNSLVAKPIMAAPSGSVIDPNDNSILNDLDSKSPAKADSSRIKVEKRSENRVRSSPTLKRGSRPSNVCGSNSESPPSGSSSLNGGSTHTSVSLGKVPPFSIRKKRKPNILLSRLSSSPSKTNVKPVNVSNALDHPSGSSQNETIVGVENMDVSGSPIVIVQAVGHTVSEAPLHKRTRRKKGILESPLDSSQELGPTPDKINDCVEDMQTISNRDEDVTKSGDKCVSDTSTEGHGHGSQIRAPVSVDNGSGEGSLKPLISVGGNEDDVDIVSVDLDNHDTLDIGNSTSGPFDAPVKIPDRVDVTFSVVNADKPCGTQVVSSPESGMIGKSCGEECLDGDDNNQNEMKNHDFLLNSSKATISSDRTVTPFTHDDVAVDSEKLTTAPDHKATDDIQERQCQGEGTVLVSGAESEGPSKAFISEGGDLTLVSTEEDAPGPVLNRKRKSRNEIQDLNVGRSGSSHDIAGSKSILMKSNHPVDKLGSVVLGLPCCIAESVPHQKGLKNSCPESITSMNHGHDSYAIEYPFHHSKKIKISPLESSDSSASQNCDLPVSSKPLISTAEVHLNSVEHCTQSEEGIKLSNTVLVEEIILGGATNRLQTARYSFTDCSSADLPHGDPCLSVNENADLDGGLSSLLPKQEGNVNVIMSGGIDGSESIALESEGRITSYESGGMHCMEIDHIGDSVHEPRVTNIGSEGNVAVNDNLPSESDPPHLCAECSDDGATTNFDMATAQSIVGSSEAGSPLTHSAHSKTISAFNLSSDGKLAIDAKRSSKPLVTQGSLSSHSKSIVKSTATNSKSGISAAPAGDHPFAKKFVVPAKNAKITTSHAIPISRQFIGRNVLVRAEGTSSSARASPVTTPSNKAPSTYPVKPRTWRRTDNLPASNTSQKKPSVSTPLQRPQIDKTMKVQSTSYIRKGNILLRNPASGAATPAPRVVGGSINQSKANAANITGKITGSREMMDSTVVPDSLMAGAQNTHVEMPKTPPLPCSGVTSDHDIGYSGDRRSSAPVGQPEAIDNEEVRKSSVTTPSSSGNPETDVDRSLEDPGTLSDGNFSVSNLKRVVYVKRKSNQLVAASNSMKPSVPKMDKAPALSSDNGYYKRRKNQLIRASSESNIEQMVAKLGDSFNSQPQKALNVYSGRNSTKRQSNKVKPQKVSLVWKLGDTKSSGKGVDPLRCGKILSHLLPWKRATYWRSVWRSSTNFSSSSSLMITRKLLSSRKRAAVYVRSGRGFSLRRSKVISLGGSSLKWSKSMEKRSKKIDEEAAQAIAAMHSVERSKTGASGERIFRIGVFRYRMDPSRRTLQRIADEGSSDAATLKTEHGARKTYVPKRLLIGSNEYVRIGNGNQLVRDPKRRTRLLANEKVRWSLHTARMRLAKKRKFCQFFTRFGKCNKGEGKCPYIHDPSKIAVCTKFLKGLCSDPSCKLTHKFIPERMPDCSFFLQGSCSNENCPYRHVNVNPKAPICESFLRGYCAEGNECQKKHSYICPEFEATGNCPEGSKCKLYHPKKEGKGKKRKTSKNQANSNSRGRYFGAELAATLDPERDMAEKRIAPKDGLQETEELGDYIGLDVSDDEPWENNDPIAGPRSLCEGEAVFSQLDDLDDELIKPLRILGSH